MWSDGGFGGGLGGRVDVDICICRSCTYGLEVTVGSVSTQRLRYLLEDAKLQGGHCAEP